MWPYFAALGALMAGGGRLPSGFRGDGRPGPPSFSSLLPFTNHVHKSLRRKYQLKFALAHKAPDLACASSTFPVSQVCRSCSVLLVLVPEAVFPEPSTNFSQWLLGDFIFQ